MFGEAKEDRCKDYLFSNFSDLKMLRTYSWIKKYDTNLAKYSKDENEAVELFLNEIGVSDDELTKIRNILLEF